MKKILLSLVIIVLAALSVFQTTEAAFSDEVSIDGSSFSVSDKNEDMKASNKEEALFFLKDVTKESDSSNLARTLSGPGYKDINVSWKQNYPVKVKNTKNVDLYLTSYAMYTGESDPENLRDDLYVKVSDWDDKNNNGKVDNGETGKTYGEDSFLRWKNDTIKLEKIEANSIKGIVFTFDGRGLSVANIDTSGKFSFHIEAVDTL